jgi:hypothetical protein
MMKISVKELENTRICTDFSEEYLLFYPKTSEDRDYGKITALLRELREYVGVLIDYRCDNRRFRSSAHNCQVPTPPYQNLELEQQIRIFGAD